MLNALLFIAATVSEPGYGRDYDPASRFGVSAEQAEYMLKIASQHASVMAPSVYGANSASTVEQWRAECAWREDCWRKMLAVVSPQAQYSRAWCLYPEYDRKPFASEYCRAKMQTLRELRDVLGDELYNAGRMPDPTPKYRPWSK